MRDLGIHSSPVYSSFQSPAGKKKVYVHVSLPLTSIFTLPTSKTDNRHGKDLCRRVKSMVKNANSYRSMFPCSLVGNTFTKPGH